MRTQMVFGVLAVVAALAAPANAAETNDRIENSAPS